MTYRNRLPTTPFTAESVGASSAWMALMMTGDANMAAAYTITSQTAWSARGIFMQLIDTLT